MRLLLLSWEFAPCIVGGLGRHVDRLTESLLAEGHEVHVLTRATPEVAVDEHRGRLHVHRVPDDPGDITLDDFVPYVLHVNRRLSRKAERILARRRFDVIHAHDWLVAHVADELRSKHGIPLVSTVHATEYGRHQGWLPNDMNRRIHQIECGLAHVSRRVIVCSDYMRQQVQSIFDLPPARLRVVENGVAVRMVDKRASERQSRSPTVLFAGRLEYEKGVQTIIEAAPRIVNRIPDVRFVVAGEGTHGDALRKLVVERGLAHRFEFLGFVGEEDMPALYRNASVLVAPSIYEPFGIVAIEGMAAGVPVVVGDTGGLRELVAHRRNGLRVPPERPKALAVAIIRVLTDARLRAKLVRGGTKATEALSWRQIARRTVDVYQEAIDENGAGGGVDEKPLRLVWKASDEYHRAIAGGDDPDEESSGEETGEASS